MKFINLLCYAWLLLAISACAPLPQAFPSNSIAETSPSPTETVKEITFTMTLGGTRRDRGINLLQTRDGGYAVVGYTSSLGAGQEDVYLVRLNPHGKTLWSKTYGGGRQG